MTAPRSWLWPDRTIGKRESGRLREEHNEAVNLLAGPVLDFLDELAQHADTAARREGARRLSRLIRPVCPNCGQWQGPGSHGDCLNECRRRGLAP